MLLEFERLLLMEPFADSMTPTEGQRQQSDQPAEPFRVSQVRLLQAKASGLERGKERFNLPPTGVLLDRIFTRRRGDQDQILTAPQVATAKVPLVAPHPARLSDDQRLIDPRGAEELPDRDKLAPSVGHLKVLPQAEVEVDLVLSQPGEPLGADEFPVGQQASDPVFAEQVKEDFHYRDPFVGVGIPGFRQDQPDDWVGNPLVDDAEHQDIQIGLSELPVGAVQRQLPLPRKPEQLDDALGQIGVGEFKEPEEALELLVLGILLSLAGESAGDFNQVDVFDRD